ncbi:hypothetical protein EX30DRAFT_256363 [Ascodesmis nigricans]|uniref:Uncharacterized protein n=1 Tax=Ascodesmis nigricans TaxID=341454 RepID=A0A4S2MI18_9PEZI|nr:hypothetical protein EX30DRAFT_256363 [Ascodesmis nigricans]
MLWFQPRVEPHYVYVGLQGPLLLSSLLPITPNIPPSRPANAPIAMFLTQTTSLLILHPPHHGTTWCVVRQPVAHRLASSSSLCTPPPGAGRRGTEISRVPGLGDVDWIGMEWSGGIWVCEIWVVGREVSVADKVGSRWRVREGLDGWRLGGLGVGREMETSSVDMRRGGEGIEIEVWKLRVKSGIVL